MSSEISTLVKQQERQGFFMGLLTGSVPFANTIAYYLMRFTEEQNQSFHNALNLHSRM